MLIWLESELNQLGQIEYALLLLLLIVLTIYCLFYAYRSFHRFRFMEATATSKVRSAAQGYVELKGLGEWMKGDQLHSPFSGNRCLWYHCSIEEKQHNGKRSTWINVFEQSSQSLFHLVDETGACVIDPEHAHVFPEIERIWYGSSLEQQNHPPENEIRWLARFRIGAGAYRFRERLIRPATQLYAIGDFQTHRNEASESSINRQVNDLIREWKLKPGKYLSEFNSDISEQEWQKLRQRARNQVMTSLSKQHKPQSLMTQSLHSEQPYILSAVAEEELVSYKKIRAALSLSAAFLLFCAILAAITIRTPVVS